MCNKFSRVKELRLVGRFGTLVLVTNTSAEPKSVAVKNAADRNLDWEADIGVLTVVDSEISTANVTQVSSGNVGGSVIQIVGSGNVVDRVAQEPAKAGRGPITIEVGPDVKIVMDSFRCKTGSISFS